MKKTHTQVPGTVSSHDFEITTHKDRENFLRICRNSLEQFESANSTVLGLCERMSNPAFAPKEAPLFVSLTKNSSLAAAAVMTPPYSPILAHFGKLNSAATRALATYLAQSSIEIPGVMGPVDAACEFAKTYCALRDAKYSITAKLRMYELTQLIQPSVGTGCLRLAELRDRALLIEWADNFHDEATPNDPKNNSAEMIDRDLTQQTIFVWENESSDPVSVVRKARPTKNTITLNFVYTPPACRGKRYASAAVAELSQRLLDEGYSRCVLFTDLGNPTSNSIYQRIGYRPVIDVDLYKF